VDGAGSLAWAGWLVLVVGLVTGFVTAAYATRAWLLVVPAAAEVPVERSGAQLVPDDAPPAVSQRRDPLLHLPVPASMSWTLLALAVPTVVAGLLLIGPGVPGAIHLSSLTGALATTAAVAGVVATGVAERLASGDPVLVLHARLRGWLAGGFGVDAAHRALVVRPTGVLARGVTVGDHDVVDAYPRAGVLLSRWAGAGLRVTQTGRTSGYLGALAAGAVVVALAGVGLR
jgi:NADH-quinone oxidoreductase subunit L